MDNKTKGMVMAGMMTGALILATLSLFGGSWISVDDAPDDLSITLSGTESGDSGVEYSDFCDLTEDDKICSMATAGTVGTIGLWVAIVFAALALAMMVLPMAGIDALDAIPDLVQKITLWGAGGLMLVSALAWVIIFPELSDGEGVGMSFYMAIIAGVLGLAAPAMGMLVKADE
tara:strand:+ start:414 stop:935 length:522 start_codon:yes stop_codon:yes gene_type:complete